MLILVAGVLYAQGFHGDATSSTQMHAASVYNSITGVHVRDVHVHSAHARATLLNRGLRVVLLRTPLQCPRFLLHDRLLKYACLHWIDAGWMYGLLPVSKPMYGRQHCTSDASICAGRQHCISGASICAGVLVRICSICTCRYCHDVLQCAAGEMHVVGCASTAYGVHAHGYACGTARRGCGRACNFYGLLESACCRMWSRM
jgi:hypothetical protein